MPSIWDLLAQHMQATAPYTPYFPPQPQAQPQQAPEQNPLMDILKQYGLAGVVGLSALVNRGGNSAPNQPPATPFPIGIRG